MLKLLCFDNEGTNQGDTALIFLSFNSGLSWSKLKMSSVKDSLKFTSSAMQIC